jgi:hypothetical protein
MIAADLREPRRQAQREPAMNFDGVGGEAINAEPERLLCIAVPILDEGEASRGKCLHRAEDRRAIGRSQAPLRVLEELGRVRQRTKRREGDRQRNLHACQLFLRTRAPP